MLVTEGILEEEKRIHLRFEPTQEQFTKLDKIPGVRRSGVVSYDRYQIKIVYSRAFDWEEIEPAVRDILWQPPQKLVLWYPLGK